MVKDDGPMFQWRKDRAKSEAIQEMKKRRTWDAGKAEGGFI